MSQAPAEHTPGRPQVLALLNAAAGSAHEEAVGHAAVGMREAADVELVPTADVGELRAALSVRGDRQLVVLGGDGALHEVVQALYDDGGAGPDGALARAGRIGVVPLGTGNDLARALGLPADPHEASTLDLQEAWRDLEPTFALDLARARGGDVDRFRALVPAFVKLVEATGRPAGFRDVNVGSME